MIDPKLGYSPKTQEMIERQCRNVEREDFTLDKEKAEELILKTYDFFSLERPKKIVWCVDIFDKDFEQSARSAWSAESAGSAGSARSAWSAGLAGSARSARSAESAWSAWSARSAESAWSARSAGLAGSARSARSARSAWSAGSAESAWSALDYDFDWYVFQFEYIENPSKDKPNENDYKYLEYCELLMQAKEAGLGYRVESEDTLYLVPTPIVRIDEQNRFHSTTEPAIRWKSGAEIYMLHGVKFEKEWWSKIVNDELTPETILAIDNLEHRRIAWEFMDKKKLEGLNGFEVLDEATDTYGNPMRVIQFEHPDAGKIRYYNCFCPTTKREYYLGTDEKTCNEAKAQSFGFKTAELEFISEW